MLVLEEEVTVGSNNKYDVDERMESYLIAKGKWEGKLSIQSCINALCNEVQQIHAGFVRTFAVNPTLSDLLDQLCNSSFIYKYFVTIVCT